MRIFLSVILIIINFQSLAKANDIKELTIEGMSIGDSLLDYFDKDEIKKTFFYKTDDYFAFTSSKYSSENYDGVQFHAKNNDKNFKIVSIEGIKLIDNMNECKKLKKEIVDDVSSIFSNVKKKEDSGNHTYDPTGDSKYFRTTFFTNPKDRWNSIEVACFDWSKELETQFGDKLTVGIKTQIFQTYLAEKAYQ